jgi:hypothetical protein
MKSLSFILKASLAGFLLAAVILFAMWPRQDKKDLEQPPALPSTPYRSEQTSPP